MRKVKLGLAFVLLLAVIMVAGCGSNNSSSDNGTGGSQSAAGYQEISGAQLKDKIDKGENIQLIDVREASEFADGHVKGAVNIPTSTFTANYGSINKDKEVYVICATGARSAAAADYLVKVGYTKVYNVTGGVSSYPGELVK